jgi:hypothetical protein
MVTGQTGASLGAGQFGFMLVMMLGSVPSVVVLVVCAVSLVVLSLLVVLLFVVNTSLGEVTTLSWRGSTVHGLPFMAFVLLQ